MVRYSHAKLIAESRMLHHSKAQESNDGLVIPICVERSLLNPRYILQVIERKSVREVVLRLRNTIQPLTRHRFHLFTEVLF